jgi:hypothetical protein
VSPIPLMVYFVRTLRLLLRRLDGWLAALLPSVSPMPLTLPALKDELLDDPLSLGYAPYVASYSNGDAQYSLNDLLNAKNYTQNVPIPIAQVVLWGAGNGALASLRSAATTPSAVQSVAIAADVLLSGSLAPTLDLTNPAIGTMLDALVQAAVLTADQKTSLLSLRVVPASRAEVLFGTDVVIEGNMVYDALAS